MSVYIPSDQTGDGVTEAWVKSRFATKTALDTKLNKPTASAVSGRLIYTNDNAGTLDYTSFNIVDISNNITNTSSNTNSINSLNTNVANINERVSVDRVRVGNLSGTGFTGVNTQGTQATAVGYLSGGTNQGEYTVAVGSNAGFSGQGANSVAVGKDSGRNNQGASSIMIGANAGYTSSVANSICLNASGSQLNPSNASLYVNPIRDDTTNTNILCYNNTSKEVNQNSTLYSGLNTSITNLNNRINTSNVKIATSAGSSSQGTNAIAIGLNAGQNNQGQRTVALGDGAGSSNQGQYSVMLGHLAGYTSSVANSICLNASDSALNPSNASLYVNPIRNNNSSNNNILTYDITSKEVSYNNTGSFNTMLKSTFNSGATGWTGIQIDASPSAGAAYVRANRATTTSGECGYAWANGGTNKWICYMPSGSDTLTWYNQTGQNAMTLDLNGKLTVKSIPQDTSGTNIMTYDTTSKELRYNNTLYTNLTSSISSTQGTVDRTKAYAYCTYNANTQTIINSYNVSSVTYSATGRYLINFSAGTFPNANYTAVVSCNKESSGDDSNMVCTTGNADRQYSASSLPVTVCFANGVGFYQNPTRVNVIVHFNNPNI